MSGWQITPEWCARMAELEDGCEIGAGALAIPDMLLSMWARRHEISDREWREAGPVLLGMAISSLSAPAEFAAEDERQGRVA